MTLKTIPHIKAISQYFEISSSKILSSFLCALFLFFIFLLLTLAIPPRSNSFGFFGSLKDKHRRLESLPSPKIVFIGGSNLAFGLDSNLVEKTFHMPVVNMGICAPLGLRYMLEEVKDHINRGDIVVLVPEYGILQNTVDGSVDLIHVIEAYPPSVLYILRGCLDSPEYIASLIKIALTVPATKWTALYDLLDKMCKKGYFDQSSLTNWEIANPLGPHMRYYFNTQGDYFGHFALPNMPYSPNWEIVKSISAEAAILLNNFDKYARQRGARVVMIPAPIPSEYLLPNMCSTQNIAHWPAQKINMPILAGPRRYAFPNSDFYGMPYHLNLVGREKRTALILEDLKQYFQRKRTISTD